MRSAARAWRTDSARQRLRATGASQSQVSEVERGCHAAVSLELLGRLAAAVGLEVSLKAYPAGPPIRDRAHIALFERFRRAVGEQWTWAAEVALPIPGDKRAWDRVLRRPGIEVGAEGETRPTDAQELGRRIALKKRDGGLDRVILLLADTEWCRRFVRLNELVASFPVPGRIALAALAAGRDPGGDSVILI